MKFQGTTKDAKRVASTLRRELQSLSKPAAELSHTQVLSLLAKSLGFKSWESLEATLPAAVNAEPTPTCLPAATSAIAERYPLKNVGGRFDFVRAGKSGTAYTCWLEGVQGAVETLSTVYGAAEVKRKGDDFELDGGESEVDWNSQAPERTAEGRRVWVDYADQRWTGNRIVLLPQDYTGNPLSDTTLPLRKELVAEFREFLKSKPLAPATAESTISQAEEVLGFALTAVEMKRLLSELGQPALSV